MLYEGIFDKLKKSAKSAGKASAKWLRQQAAKLDSTSPLTLLKDRDKLVSTPKVGGMYMYLYDPRDKKKLPYYDRFPLCVIVDKYNGGFMGINLHYVPPQLRAKFMDSYVNKEGNSLNVPSKLIKSIPWNNTVKRYLTKQVRSKFLTVPSSEWDMAIFLPVERFEKKSKSGVWSLGRR